MRWGRPYAGPYCRYSYGTRSPHVIGVTTGATVLGPRADCSGQGTDRSPSRAVKGGVLILPPFDLGLSRKGAQGVRSVILPRTAPPTGVVGPPYCPPPLRLRRLLQGLEVERWANPSLLGWVGLFPPPLD